MTNLMERSLILAAAGLALLVAVEIRAEDNPDPGQVFITAAVASVEELGSLDTPGKAGGAFSLGGGVTNRLAFELTFADMERVDLTWMGGLYSLGAQGALKPYLVAGVGRAEVEEALTGNEESHLQAFGGVGAFLELGRRASLRADVRIVRTEDTNGMDPFAQLGLSIFLGALTPDAPVAPSDLDGDGVPDSRDKCPRTRSGVVVGADGCELDSDGDGVADSADRCPDTPRGVPVDARGCVLDSDGDGVPDHQDACPDTERGAKVDDKGCYIELEKVVTIDLTLEFDVNSADIKPSHVPEIGRVVNFLRQYPTADAVIEGHTDSTGSEAHNQTLSEARARSVYEYLIRDAGVRSDRLTHLGYGESRPIATNDTAEGRERNRRVTAKVSGKQTVRQ